MADESLHKCWLRSEKIPHPALTRTQTHSTCYYWIIAQPITSELCLCPFQQHNDVPVKTRLVTVFTMSSLRNTLYYHVHSETGRYSKTLYLQQKDCRPKIVIANNAGCFSLLTHTKTIQSYRSQPFQDVFHASGKSGQNKSLKFGKYAFKRTTDFVFELKIKSFISDLNVSCTVALWMRIML